jgi:hypothetical protein
MGSMVSSNQEMAAMTRLTIPIFALTLASSVYALPLPPVQPQDGITVAVREGCGAGYQRVGNRCVRNTAVRQFRRCAAGYRLVGARCIRR